MGCGVYFKWQKGRAAVSFVPLRAAVIDQWVQVCMCQCPVATITNYHEFGGLKDTLTVVEVRIPKIKVSTGLYSFWRFKGGYISLFLEIA